MTFQTCVQILNNSKWAWYGRKGRKVEIEMQRYVVVEKYRKMFQWKFSSILLIVENLIYTEYMLKVRNYSKLNMERFTAVLLESCCTIYIHKL